MEFFIQILIDNWRLIVGLSLIIFVFRYFYLKEITFGIFTFGRKKHNKGSKSNKSGIVKNIMVGKNKISSFIDKVWITGNLMVGRNEIKVGKKNGKNKQ
jgi:hypothetical protein